MRKDIQLNDICKRYICKLSFQTFANIQPFVWEVELMSVMIKESCETTDHKRPNKHFRGLWLSFKTNKMGSSFGTTVIMKKHPDNVLFHNRHSSFLERAVPLLLFGMLAQNIVAFYEHFHVWSLMSDLMPKETASISECCGWEHFVHRDVLCGLVFF